MIARLLARRFLLAIISGLILAFAYPGWNIEAALWLWMFPLLAILWPWPQETSAPRPFWLGFAAGMAFFIPNLFWVRHSSRVFGGALDNSWIGIGPELLGLGAVIGLSGCCALCFAGWAWFTARFARPKLRRLTHGSWAVSTCESLLSAFLAAAAWVSLEWLRGLFLFSGFGWNGLGVGLHQNIALIQVVDLIGVTGLSFLPVFVVCCAYNAATRLILVYRGQGTCRARLDFTVAMVLILASVAYGGYKLTRVDKNMVTVRTALVQPNIPQVVRWSAREPEILGMYDQLADLTRLYAETRDGKPGVDLVIWPESALPVNLFDSFHMFPPGENARYLNNLLSMGDFSLLTGTEVRATKGDEHNSVALLHGHQDDQFSTAQFYHKINLVAFGEYLPLRNIPPFSFLQGVLPGDFVPGASTEPLKLAKPQVDIIPLICFEDTVGRLARLFVRDAPQILVNVTNDGWFLESSETEVHLANAMFRCIELRRPMCRAANTGISCFIDTMGRVTSRLSDSQTGSTFLEGCLRGEVLVPAKPEMTLYARYGDWFPISLLAITAAAIIVRWRGRKDYFKAGI